MARRTENEYVPTSRERSLKPKFHQETTTTHPSTSFTLRHFSTSRNKSTRSNTPFQKFEEQEHQSNFSPSALDHEGKNREPFLFSFEKFPLVFSLLNIFGARHHCCCCYHEIWRVWMNCLHASELEAEAGVCWVEGGNWLFAQKTAAVQCSSIERAVR